MASVVTTQAAAGAPARSDRFTRWARDIRLVSGIVLMVFATTHFINHAMGVFGVDAMVAVQGWRQAVWKSWPGTIILYGSFIVHPVFGLARIAHRRTIRIPMREIVQIALGLAIPFLLIDHIVGTRVVGSFFGLNESYPAVLQRLWPNLSVSQSLLLLVVWVHGVLGLHHTLRTRDWYENWRDVLLAGAVLVPVTALIGFMVGGREAALLTLPPDDYSDALVTTFTLSTMWGKIGFYGLTLGFVGFAAIRELRLRATKKINVRFVGHGARSVVPGPTVLEISRRHQIPIAALCGGRARCATCRVLVLNGEEHLAAPGVNEEKLLRRISAPSHVRLACQLRPNHDLRVQVLLPADTRASVGTRNYVPSQEGGQTEVTVLIADLRAFSTLAQQQLPHDLINLLNRFVDEMGQAIGSHGGRIETFYGDGLMAVFGLGTAPRQGCRAAIAAAADMLRAVDSLNRELAKALPLPLRVGIGVHTGRAVVGTIDSGVLGRRELTVGSTVSIASQLEGATRRLLADLIVSDEAIRISGREFRGTTQHQLVVRGRDQPILVHAFAAAPESETTGATDKSVEASAPA